MNDIETFKILIEIISLVLSLSIQSPILGIIAGIGILLLLLVSEDKNNS